MYGTWNLIGDSVEGGDKRSSGLKQSFSEQEEEKENEVQ